MNRSSLMSYLKILLVAVIAALSLACSTAPSAGNNSANSAKKIKIGLSMDTLKEERWQKDRDMFVKRAEELGAEVVVQSADGNDETQVKQAESLLTQGVDVLVVNPHIVDAARRQNVPVISYDRLIKNSIPELYISFDNEKVGELQAKYLLDRAPKGNYILIGGAPTDNNAKLLRKGQLNILQPAIDKGDIKIVADQWAKDWLADEALKHTENALTQNNNDVVAVVASNDSTAGGVVEALKPQGLAGKVLVSGQDADLAALQRVAAGTQSMTVYKPISQIAPRAAELAVALAKKEAPQATRAINNGKADIPSILLDPITVDKGNIDSTVIKDGYQKREDVYKNAPSH
jgi:D-xylose transport system substrate-binding protein